MSAARFREDLPARLRGPSAAPIPCKVCSSPAPLFGSVDFNRSCEEARGHRLPDSGISIAYRRCDRCGLLFTDAFDDWAEADFLAHIYNADYPEVDPDTVERRPRANAAWFAETFAADKDQLDILDYGGGNGRFAADLRAASFRCEAYDPMVTEFAVRPGRRFSVVTSFETLEHLSDPVTGAGDIAALLTEDGVAFITTLAQPSDFARLGMGWWYIGPRNGHVTLFTRQALARLWARFGLSVTSFSDNLHMIFRSAVPEYVREAQKRAQARVRSA